MHRPRRVSLQPVTQPELLRDGDKLGQKLEPVTEVTTYLVTHYVPKSAMEHEDRVRTRQLLDEIGASHDPEREAGRESRCSVQSTATAARTVRSLGQKRGTKTGD
jgi:hypothetical protein